MYSQTHVYFAERVLGKQGDMITLGSILPDMIIGGDIGHYEAHCQGIELLAYISKDQSLLDLARAVSTHGFDPRGLDYYGDEKYLDYERGYCFEKARTLVERTVEACDIPAKMGWWKAHNIIEMGVETIISAQDTYWARLSAALLNKNLIKTVDALLRQMHGARGIDFMGRVARFSGIVEKEKATPESLAVKFSSQMLARHQARIDLPKTAELIREARELVTDDLQDFFAVATGLTQDNIARVFGDVTET